jgi:hypothetical protein
MAEELDEEAVWITVAVRSGGDEEECDSGDGASSEIDGS